MVDVLKPRLECSKSGLAYRLWGNPERPPLLLLHGFLGNQAEWNFWLPRLTRHWYCLCVDLPGHGDSDRVFLDERNGFTQQSEALSLLMAQVSDRCWAIWGYSLGGRVALHLASISSSSLRWLLIESANPGLASEPERIARRAHDERWALAFAQEPIVQVLERWYRQPVFSDLDKTAREQLISLRKQNNPATLAAMLRATSLGRQPDLRQRLYSLSCPWLYLAGAKDGKFARIGQQFPRSCQQQLPEAGHNIHRERPDALWSALQSFLSRAGLVKELQ